MGEAPNPRDPDIAGGGIICAGNWIVDIVHSIDHWPEKNDLARIQSATQGVGGGAANVLTDLASLKPDLPLFPVGCIGDDEYADFVLKHCEKLNVKPTHLHSVPDVATAHTHVMSVTGESRTFFYAGGANDHFCENHVPIDALAQSGAKLFYMGYIMLLAKMDQLGADGTTDAAVVLQKARQAGLTTCVDLVSASHTQFTEIVSAAAPHIDYLILNEVEAGRASGVEIPAANHPQLRDAVLQAGQKLLAFGIQQAVIIHTPDTALWVDANDGHRWSDATKLRDEDIVSPVGAGDAFCAGILYGLHEQFSPEKTMELAHKMAAANLRAPTANGGIPHIDTLV